MSAEIYTKSFITINEEDFEVGDMIMHLRWKLDDETENEMYEAIILDITDDSIIVYSNVDGKPMDEIEIKVDSIIQPLNNESIWKRKVKMVRL